jgi:hypothetical protein
VPILLHTNHAFSSLALEAKKNGIREVLNKSISEQELLSAVEALLNERAAGAGDAVRIDEVADIDVLATDGKVPTVGTLADVSKLPELDKPPDQDHQDQQAPQKFEAP